MLWMRAAGHWDRGHLEHATTEFVTHKPALHSGPSMPIECDFLFGMVHQFVHQYALIKEVIFIPTVRQIK
jgi:hypothetical protein